MRIGHHPPNLTLWLLREAAHIRDYQPALLPPCPCADAPAPSTDTCTLTVRPADPPLPDPAARPHEPTLDRSQSPVADALPPTEPDRPAPESTDPVLAPAAPGAIGDFLDVFA